MPDNKGYDQDFNFDDLDAFINDENRKHFNAPKSEEIRRNEETDKGPDDFKIEFDFDKEYEPQSEIVEGDAPDKKKGCMGNLLYFAFVIGVSIILAVVGWFAATDVLGFGKEDKEVTVTIPQEYTMREVTNILHDNDLIKYKGLFKLYAGISSADEKIAGGTYMLNTKYDYRALVNGMTPGGGVRVETTVTIPEGYTLSQIFKTLEENQVCYAEELWEVAANYDFDYDFLDSSTLGNKTRLEGYLFPDTYEFYMNDNPEKVIGKMLDNFNSKFTDEMKGKLETVGYDMHDVIIIASMIEKEAGADSERANIASVLYNRLKSPNFPYLQIDATIYYGIAETGEEFSTEADTPYNTYKNRGLPPGPIANPGLASIKAALSPSNTNYYYYALGTDGVHAFFNSYDSFTNFVNSDQYGG